MDTKTTKKNFATHKNLELLDLSKKFLENLLYIFVTAEKCLKKFEAVFVKCI
jgi:hypothetical protein